MSSAKAKKILKWKSYLNSNQTLELTRLYKVYLNKNKNKLQNYIKSDKFLSKKLINESCYISCYGLE